MTLTFRDEVLAIRALDVPVSVRLERTREACERRLPEYAAAVDAFVSRLREAGAGASTPGIGDFLPDFTLPDQGGRLVRLEHALAAGPVAVAFHRGFWCTFCRVNLAALAEAQPALAACGARLIAVSPQRARWGALHLRDAGATLPMLCDVGSGFAASIGLAVRLDDRLLALLADLGDDLAEMNGDGGGIIPIPATFVLDGKGRILARHLNPDFRERMDPAAMLQALAAVKATPDDASGDAVGRDPSPTSS